MSNPPPVARPPSAPAVLPASPPEPGRVITITMNASLLTLVVKTAQVLLSAREVSTADRAALSEFIRYAQSRLGSEPEPARSVYVPR